MRDERSLRSIRAVVAIAALLTAVAPAMASSQQANAAGSWTPISCGLACRGNDLLAVDFVNDETGWAAGVGGVVVRTDNAGVSWRRQEVPLEADITTLRFRDRFTGYAGGRFRGLLITDDGGRNWRYVKDIPAAVSDLAFTNSGTFAIGGRNLYRSDDGQQWTAIGPLDAGSIDFVYDQRGWAAGEDVLTTEDGGRTWGVVDVGSARGWTAIDFTSAAEGWVAGSTGLLATADGGATWEELRCAPSCAHLRDAVQGSDGVGLVVGDDGLIAESSDGGESWASPQLTPPVASASIAAVDVVGDRAWAVTEGATVFTRGVLPVVGPTKPWATAGFALVALAVILVLAMLMSRRSPMPVRFRFALAGIAVVAGAAGVVAMTARWCPSQGCDADLVVATGEPSVATTSTTTDEDDEDGVATTTTTEAAGSDGDNNDVGTTTTTVRNGDSPVGTTTTSTAVESEPTTTTTTAPAAVHEPLTVSPTFLDQNCYGPNGQAGDNDDNLPPFVVTLDNTRGLEVVSFSIVIRGQTWDRRPWATASPLRGAVEPGEFLDVVVTPDQASCWFANGFSGEYFLDITRSDGPLVTVTDRVSGYRIAG